LLRAKGWSAAEAEPVATYSQYVDDFPTWGDAPTVGAMALYETEPAVRNLLYGINADFHFYGSSQTTVTEAGNCTKKLKGALENYKEKNGGEEAAALVGRWLHTFADTFSHQLFTAYTSENNKRKGYGFPYNSAPPMAHAQAGHDPDLPYMHLATAIETAKAIYDLLPPRGAVREWSDVEKDLTKVLTDPKTTFVVVSEEFFSGSHTFVFEYTLNRRVDALKSLIKATFGDDVTYDKKKGNAALYARVTGLDKRIEEYQQALKESVERNPHTVPFGY